MKNLVRVGSRPALRGCRESGNGFCAIWSAGLDLTGEASAVNATVRGVYSAGLSCGGCFAAYDATAGAEDELYGLFCKFCGSALEVVPVEPRGVDDELAADSVQLRVVQAPLGLG